MPCDRIYVQIPREFEMRGARVSMYRDSSYIGEKMAAPSVSILLR